MTARGRTRGRTTFGGSHEAQAAGDHAPDRLAGLRVFGQGRIFHALADFVSPHCVALARRDCFVDVNGHAGNFAGPAFQSSDFPEGPRALLAAGFGDTLNFPKRATTPSDT